MECDVPCSKCYERTSEDCSECINGFYLDGSKCDTVCPGIMFKHTSDNKCYDSCPVNFYGDTDDYFCKSCNTVC